MIFNVIRVMVCVLVRHAFLLTLLLSTQAALKEGGKSLGGGL